LGGFISDRIFKGNRWQIVCISNLIIVASLLIVAFSGGTLMAIAIIIAYAAVSMVMGPFWAIPPELGHPSIATEASGFVLVFGNLGGTIIGFILTALATASGTYYVPMFLCLIMALISALGVSRIKR
jgi:sugar phosphate permease